MDTIQCADTAAEAGCENRTGIVTSGNIYVGPGQLGRPGRDYPAPAVSRARLKELFALAYETVAWLESKGLQKGEQCEFREIAERLWWKD